MDLGIRGKTAIVCASSRGLGKGCAEALAEAGCDLVVNGRDEKVLARTATEIRDRFGVKVIEVPGDVADPAIQKKLLAAVPQVDILVNNNGGPPYRPFKELDREAILERRHQQHDRAAGTHPGRHGRHGRARFRPHRQHHVAVGLHADPRPRPLLRRARRSDLLPGGRGADRRRQERHHQPDPARQARHRPPARPARARLGRGPSGGRERKAEQASNVPAKRLGTPAEFGQVCAFLCSVHAGYLTGQNIRVDGGLYPGAF